MAKKKDQHLIDAFAAFPVQARTKLLEVRALILDVANEERLGAVREELKWGQPSYAVVKGSPVRLGWQHTHPNQVSLFFNCQTNLVETFRELYGNTFEYVGRRQLVLDQTESLPTLKLKTCLSMALRYHRIKHLPLLGN